MLMPAFVSGYFISIFTNSTLVISYSDKDGWRKILRHFRYSVMKKENGCANTQRSVKRWATFPAIPCHWPFLEDWSSCLTLLVHCFVPLLWGKIQRWSMCMFILHDGRVKKLVRELDEDLACLQLRNAIKSLDWWYQKNWHLGLFV